MMEAEGAEIGGREWKIQRKDRPKSKDVVRRDEEKTGAKLIKSLAKGARVLTKDFFTISVQKVLLRVLPA